MMIKRPQFTDNEEKLADAEETLDSRKTHHHLSKGHASRHHKKHDKTTHTTADRDTTTESSTKFDTTLRNEKVSTVEGKFDKDNITSFETFITETVVETSTSILTTVKPKKTPRRQKIKETSANRTEIEEDKPQRRRKVHHHRKNNTLLTNSVHDDVPRVNTTETSDVLSSTRDPTTSERQTYGRQKFTTVPTTIAETSTMRQEFIDVSRISSDLNQDHITESIPVSESGTTATMTSIHTTENVPRTSATIGKGSSSNRSRSTSLTVPTTTPLPRKYSKVQRNRTSGILGPARIDVTILEAPDRKHKQGKIANEIFTILIEFYLQMVSHYIMFNTGITTISNNNGRLPPIMNTPLEARHKCYCAPDTKKDEKELAREERRRLKEERLKKKERKLRKKAKLEKECLTEKMNCFEHDNDHWRTAPLWNAGPFCFCMNANNNTYSCIRTINVTHNFLYCEFTTGLVTYYNLRIGKYTK